MKEDSQAESTEPDASAPGGYGAADAVLATLAGTLNTLGQVVAGHVSMGVTLLVSGQKLTGQLISAGAWWDGFVDNLRAESQIVNDENGAVILSTLADSYEKLRTELYGPRGSTEQAEPTNPIGFLHLVDVKKYPGPSTMARLRLRITEVQGWELGNRE